VLLTPLPVAPICTRLHPPARTCTHLHAPVPSCTQLHLSVQHLSVPICPLVHPRAQVLYIHCSKGHGRTGTVCALLLGLAYHLSGSHAINLYQALHDVSSKAFRRDLFAADVTICLESDSGVPPVQRTVSAAQARSLPYIRSLAAAHGKGHQTRPAADRGFPTDQPRGFPTDEPRGFLAYTAAGDRVLLEDSAVLGEVVDGLLNVHLPESTPTLLRLQPLSTDELISRGGGGARAAAQRDPSAYSAYNTASSATTAAAANAARATSNSGAFGVAGHTSTVEQTISQMDLLMPNCGHCFALCPDQIRQVLRLLKFTTKEMVRAHKKDLRWTRRQHAELRGGSVRPDRLGVAYRDTVAESSSPSERVSLASPEATAMTKERPQFSETSGDSTSVSPRARRQSDRAGGGCLLM